MIESARAIRVDRPSERHSAGDVEKHGEFRTELTGLIPNENVEVR